MTIQQRINLDNKEENKEFKSKYGLTVEGMFDAGLHLGHVKSNWSPSMSQYIFAVRNGVRVIDLEQSIVKFEEVLDFMKETIGAGKKVLFVGTRMQDKDIVRELADELGMPYVNNRWVGGLFTNFNIIKKRLKYFRDLESKKTEGDLEKYTKKERLMFDKELEDLEKFMGGIKSLEELPEVVFVFDIIKDHYALKESKKSGLKVVAVVNTDSNPNLPDFSIPASNSSLTSLRYIADKIKGASASKKKSE